MKKLFGKTLIASVLLALPASQLSFQLFGSDSAKPGWKRPRLELSGGLGFINPGQLNLVCQADKTFHSLFFIDLRPEWGYYQDESHVHYKSIKRSFTPGLRLVYPVSRLFSISIGLQAGKGQADSRVDYNFIYHGYWHQNRKDFSRYELVVKNFQVDFGLHFDKPFGLYSLGAFIAAGPQFASFSHHKEWIWFEDKMVNITSRIERVFEQNGREIMAGRGAGVAVHLGGRLAREINSWLALFIAVQGSWQRVFALKGTHELSAGDYQLKKQGKWTIDEHNYYDPDLRQEMFFKYPVIEDGAIKMGLNLSGLQLRLGLALKL